MSKRSFIRTSAIALSCGLIVNLCAPAQSAQQQPTNRVPPFRVFLENSGCSVRPQRYKPGTTMLIVDNQSSLVSDLVLKTADNLPVLSIGSLAPKKQWFAAVDLDAGTYTLASESSGVACLLKSE